MPEPPKTSRSGMSRLQQAQMDWALKPQEQRDGVRAKYNIKPSNLGGKLHRARMDRLENATGRKRAQMVGRSVKSGAKRGARAAKKDVKQAVSDTSRSWSQKFKNIRKGFFAKAGQFREYVRGGRQRERSLDVVPQLPAAHEPAQRIKPRGELDALTEMEKAKAYEMHAEFRDGTLHLTEKHKVSFAAARRKVFGGKKDANKAKNQASIRATLDYVESQTSKAVRKQVENAYIKLDGDPPGSKLTVKDRIDRGTFLSSNFIAQLKHATIHAQKAVVMAQNQQTVDNFFSTQPSTAQNKIDPMYDDLFSETANKAQDKEVEKSGLSHWIDDKVADGGFKSFPAKDFPKTYETLQNAIHEQTQAPPDDVGKNRRDGFLGPLRARVDQLQSEAANAKLGATGRDSPIQIHDQNLRNAAENHFGSKKVFGKVVASVNANLIQEHTTRGPDLNKNLATAVRGYVNANDAQTVGDITQDEVDWLADQIENEEYLDLPEPNLAKRMFPSYDEGRDMFNITEQLRSEMIDGVTQLQPEFREELAELRARNAPVKDVVTLEKKVVSHLKNLQEFKPETFSKLLGGTVKKIIHERRARLDQINKKQATFRRQNETQLGDNLSKFPDLNNAAASVKRGAYPGLAKGKIAKAGDFFKTVLEDDIGGVPKEYEPGLAALDKFAELQDKLQEIGQKGGIEHADEETLQQIQMTARQLSGQVKTLEKLGHYVAGAAEVDVDEDDGQQARSSDLQSAQQLKALGKALQAAAKTIDEEVKPYQNAVSDVQESNAERRLTHLPHVRQQHNDLLVASQDKDYAGVDPKTRQGKVPSKIVGSGFEAAFKETGMGQWKNKSRMGTNPMTQYQKFAAKSLPVLDEYAQFAVDHEEDTRIHRRVDHNPQSKTQSDQNRLDSFVKDATQMREKVLQMKKGVGELRRVFESSRPPKGAAKQAAAVGDGSMKNLGDDVDIRAGSGLPDEVEFLLQNLERQVDGMENALTQGQFVGTDGVSPDPQLDGGALARPWTDTSRKLESIDQLAKELNGQDSFIHDDTHDTIAPFKEFNENLVETMKRNPIAQRSPKWKTAAGKLDLQAEDVRQDLQDLKGRIESLRQLENQVSNLDNEQLPSVWAHWAGPKDDLGLPPDQGKEKEVYLANLKSAREDLEAQVGHMENRLEDYRTYRGRDFPNASVDAAVIGAGESIRSWTASRSGNQALVRSLRKTGQPLIDKAGGQGTTEQNVKETMDALGKGISSLGRMQNTPDIATEPSLTMPYRPTDNQLKSLKEAQANYARDLQNLQVLSTQASKMSQEVKTLSGNPDEITQALDDVPGGMAWVNLDIALKEAVHKATEKKAAIDNAISLAEQRPLAKDAIPGSQDLQARAQTTRDAIGQQEQLAASVAIDQSRLPQGPQRYSPQIHDQKNTALPHGAMNAFLGGEVVNQEKVAAFQQAWDQSKQGDVAPGIGADMGAEVPWAYLDYLNKSGQSPHQVELHTWDPTSPDAAQELLKVNVGNGPVMIGTQDPPEYRTFYKDNSDNWLMVEPNKIIQKRVTPQQFLIENAIEHVDLDGEPAGAGNRLVSVITASQAQE